MSFKVKPSNSPLLRRVSEVSYRRYQRLGEEINYKRPIEKRGSYQSYFPTNEEYMALALDSLHSSARMGHSKAQNELGFFYFNGEAGLQENQEIAFNYFKLAAEGGDEESMHMLALKYIQGTPEERRLGCQYLHQLAKENCADAQYELSCEYQNGDSIPTDLEKANYWNGRYHGNPPTSILFESYV